MKEVNKPKLRVHYYLGFIFLVLAGYVIWVFQFSYPDLSPHYVISSYNIPTTSNTLPLPTYGQSAVGLGSYNGDLAESGKQAPAPIASVAKLITALCVLAKYPITNVSSSPVITLSSSDVAIYSSYLKVGGSVVPVVAGETITEYQMLEAMLLPSADNMADSLAIWAFGSLSNYASYANSYLSKESLNETHIGSDASGYDPSTVSTASDLIKLAQLVSSSSATAQIVASSSVSSIPVAGTIKNVNSLLGMSGINGMKTGNTTQAGGVFLSSSVLTINKAPITLYTAVMGAPTLWEAINDSYKLITASQANFQLPPGLNTIQKGSVIGEYSVPWSDAKIKAIATANLPLTVWKGNTVDVIVDLKSISDQSISGSVVGIVSAVDTKFNNHTDTNVTLVGTIPQPSHWWLLTHPNVSLSL